MCGLAAAYNRYTNAVQSVGGSVWEGAVSSNAENHTFSFGCGSNTVLRSCNRKA
jgi:hypothetical protein